MFFVVRSNDSFNFPLGLIKYIVISSSFCVCVAEGGGALLDFFVFPAFSFLLLLLLLLANGIAQWLERRTRDRKVAGSNPCWSGGRIFFSRVNFLC